MGPFKLSGMGDPVPVEWPDVAAFASLTGRIDEPWQAEALIRMSQAYVLGRAAGRDPLSYSPLERTEHDGD